MSGEPRILLQDVGPNGNVEAVVEDDGRATYLYWNPAPALKRTMRAVWLRNAGAAPADFDTAGMQDGRAPQLPAPFCKFPMGGQPSMEAAALHVEWSEDGESIFLLEREELLAVVPGWLADGGFSRDAKLDAPIAGALNAERLADLTPRLTRAQAFWQRWTDAASWPAIRDPARAALEASLGAAKRAFPISREPWPPKELATFLVEQGSVACTVGVGLRPQPAVERDAHELAPRLQRIELGIALDASVAGDAQANLWGFVGGQAEYPWAMLRWLGNGHTLDCDFIPAGQAKFPSMLLLTSPAGAPKLALPPIDGEPVSLLWMIPITDAERAFARASGSAQLAAKLAAAGVTWMFRDRPQISL